MHIRLALSDNPSTPGVGTVNVHNSIVRNNVGPEQIQVELLDPGVTAHVTYSNVEGGHKGVGNIDTAPLFVNPATLDYRLAAGSAGIDAGDNGAIDPAIVGDLGGRPRFRDDADTPDTGLGSPPIVDIGAHEFQPCPADIDGNASVDVDDLMAVILSWGCTDPPGPCPADVNEDGTVDVDDLILVILAWGPC
jgi:hypothetical protein